MPLAAVDRTARADALRRFIRDVPDFPKAGILFRDITPLLANAEALATTIELLAEVAAPRRPDVIVAVESRGFLLGAALAVEMGLGLVLARKPGKLPAKRRRVEYALEYNDSSALEMHEGSLAPGARALVVDDVLATGGTAEATARLVALEGGNVVGYSFAIELGFLGGRQRLVGSGPDEVDALITY